MERHRVRRLRAGTEVFELPPESRRLMLSKRRRVDTKESFRHLLGSRRSLCKTAARGHLRSYCRRLNSPSSVFVGKSARLVDDIAIKIPELGWTA